MRVGFSGHQALRAPVRAFVRQALKRELGGDAQLVGITSLAAGADHLFAEAVLAFGGSLEVVLPSAGYEITFSNGSDLKKYQQLLRQAAAVRTLPFDVPSEDAFWAAGRSVVDRCDLLIVVWDGLASRGLGGTADVVEYARNIAKPIRVIWPEWAGAH